MTAEAEHWPIRTVVTGPCEEIQLLDATWQGAPVWCPGDGWVATEAPDLAYPGPPHPGILIRIGLPTGARLELTIARQEPDEDLQCVFRSELINGGNGLVVHPGLAEDLQLPEGNYPVGVWIDADHPNAVRRCVVVLGDRRPHELGVPKQ